MNCTEFRRSLELPSADARAAAAAHRQSCQAAECQQAWAEAEWLDRAIAAWKVSVPRVHCGDRVVAQWKSDRAGTSSHHPVTPLRSVRPAAGGGGSPAATSSAWIVLASALAVLAAVAVVGSSSAPQRGVIADRDAGAASDVAMPDGPASVEPSPVVAGPTNPDQGMQDIGLAYVGVAQSATRFMTDVVMLTFGDRKEIEEPSIDQQWIDRWGRQLQPVGEGVDNAVDGILKSFPDSSSI